MDNLIPVIDLFAGPGGLGEGFSAFKDQDGNNAFKIVLSIEKEINAHSTLELRAFYREFLDSKIPPEYYSYLRGNLSKEELFNYYPAQSVRAKAQAWLAELGSGDPSNDEIDCRIRSAINKNKYWVLIGGPPCQAYSIAGRSRMKKMVDFEKDQRHYLYKEYLRIVAIHQPPVFVVENVKGILSSKIKGENIIEKIFNDLRDPANALSLQDSYPKKIKPVKYRIFSLVKPSLNECNLAPIDYVIKSENYGIPQKRHRVILLGIRENIDIIPTTLIEAPIKYSLEQAIYDLPILRSGISKEPDSEMSWGKALNSITELEWITSSFISSKLRNEMLTQLKNMRKKCGLGARFLKVNNKPEILSDWYHDPQLGGICNHVARSHMRMDLYRYFFASCFTKIYGKSPKLNEFPKELLPNHKNVRNALRGKMFEDRFRVQVASEPSTTIMSHISKDGHYYIHPDPTQCRSLSVREAARLQTFPDNYFFEGNQTSQYQQVGNAVPPLLAMQMSKIVYDALRSYQFPSLPLFLE
jgi:DNA (cytosine-5)-methyltransferase 1